MTLLLSDKQLSLKHEITKSLMKIVLGDKIWTKKERNENFEKAVDVYLYKQYGKKIAEPPKKVFGMECDNENTQERF